MHKSQGRTKTSKLNINTKIKNFSSIESTMRKVPISAKWEKIFVASKPIKRIHF